ncbi:hypothetical protein [Siphonobacter sp. SORGH_AS_1065]|uniref:hypothetical protein n=1 Tax=Siphonobacter sp. SORGH_AS_1065 TaxID=3041795 RepID=UPI002785C44E|nr:hypothetical protein [Siphonobacter sp. SORGH_AS_1065]MDQ1087174.1 hypothetical protein [Siphonobacter sp. SORGH_AS_1065]
MNALQILNDLSFEATRRAHPSVPDYAIPKPRFSDKTPNELTRAIISCIHLHNFQAERISVEGRVIDTRKTFTDVIGRRRIIGSVTRIKSSGQKGSADVSATIKGRSVKIEVKIGRDRQSADQIKYQSEIEAAGGVYLIIKDFESFFDWFKGFIK